MSAQQEAVALYCYLEGRGFKPSVRSVGRALRDQGLKFTDTDLRAWLAPFRRSADAAPTQKSSTNDAAPTQDRRSYAREKEVSLVSKTPTSVVSRGKPLDLILTPVRSKNDQPTLFTVQKAARSPSTAWVDTLTGRIPALYAKLIGDLTFEERLLLGQYHALKFGNCTKSERVNLARARNLAASFARMATHPDLCGRTVEWYLRHGNRVWIAGGRSPWFKPFDVLASIEYQDTG